MSVSTYWFALCIVQINLDVPDIIKSIQRIGNDILYCFIFVTITRYICLDLEMHRITNGHVISLVVPAPWIYNCLFQCHVRTLRVYRRVCPDLKIISRTNASSLHTVHIIINTDNHRIVNPVSTRCGFHKNKVCSYFQPFCHGSSRYFLNCLKRIDKSGTVCLARGNLLRDIRDFLRCRAFHVSNGISIYHLVSGKRVSFIFGIDDLVKAYRVSRL